MHREESQLATKQQTTRLNLLSATPPLSHITSPQTIAISILASFINVALYLLLSTNSPTCVVKMGLRFQLLSRFIYGKLATIMGCQLKICYPSAPPCSPPKPRISHHLLGLLPHMSAPLLSNRHLYRTSPAHIQKQHAPEDTTADKLENIRLVRRQRHPSSKGQTGILTPHKAKWGCQGAPLQIAPTGSDLNIRADPPGEAARRN